MSLIEIVRTSVANQMERLAYQIEREYKDAVTRGLKHPENSSGRASGSIHVEKTGEYSYFIGSDDDHLYWFEEGNGSGGIPKGGKKPKRPMPMTYGTLGSAKGFAMRASNYAGQHKNKEVADRHR